MIDDADSSPRITVDTAHLSVASFSVQRKRSKSQELIRFSGAVEGEGKWFFEVASETGLEGIVGKRKEHHPKDVDGLSLFDLTETGKAPKSLLNRHERLSQPKFKLRKTECSRPESTTKLVAV